MMSTTLSSARSTEENSLETGDLLRVDYESERRRVGEGQIRGAGQVPLELVRRAIRTGARSVAVDFHGSRLLVRDDGRGVDEDTLSALADLLDAGAGPESRHRALVALESKHELGFLALPAIGARSLGIRASAPSPAIEFAWRRGERPRVGNMRSGVSDGRNVIELDAPLDRSAVRAELIEHCRFAAARIVIDGHPAQQGFSDAFAKRPLRPPLDGVVALPPRALSPRVFLLLDGIVAAHVTLPEGPPCEAIVEMSGWVGGRRSPASLREAFRGHEASIASDALELMLDRARAMRALDADEQRLLRRGLLTAARSGAARGEVLRVPLLPALVGGQERWLSLLDLGRERTMLSAIFPNQERGRFVLSEAPVLVLDGDERTLLGELLGLGFRTPAERPRMRRSLSHRAHAALRLVRGAWDSLRGARAVSDSAITPLERETLRKLRSQLIGVARDVRLCAGRGPARLDGDVLVLPRGNAEWLAGRLVASRDSAWLYPLVIALLAERSPRLETAQRMWRERWHPGSPVPDHGHA